MSEKRFSGFSNNFGAIRILPAIAVVFSDSFLLGDGVTNADPMKRFNHGEAITGHVAVDLFFIMSGYLITLSLMRELLYRVISGIASGACIRDSFLQRYLAFWSCCR